jgi:hypothetical protein
VTRVFFIAFASLAVAGQAFAQQSPQTNQAISAALNTNVIAAIHRSVDFERTRPVSLDLDARRRTDARMEREGAVRIAESLYVDRRLIAGSEPPDRDAIRVRKPQ